MIISRCGGVLALASLLAALLISLPLTAGAAAGGGAATPSPYLGYDANKEFQGGLKALDAGRYHDAKQKFEHVLAVLPGQPTVLFKLGQTDAALGLLRDAARAYQDSLYADPRQIMAARELAIADLKLGRYDAALAQLQNLRQRAEACGVSCPEAVDLQGAVHDVEAALSSAGGAAARASKTGAS